MPESLAGLYIHVPFCVKKCSYCDFYSVTDLSLESAFIESLIREAAIYSPSQLRFDTVYFGGGTPSLLKISHIARVLEVLHRSFEIDADAEITLEANPGTVRYDQFRSLRALGINRVNIGVQSFQDANLFFLGRIHSAEQGALAVEWAREAGFGNIGLDLIYGLPGQTEASWLPDLRTAIGFNPEHLSCYMLTCEPGTPLFRDLERKRFQPSSGEIVGGLFETTMEVLESYGYSQYEISNFARSEQSASTLYGGDDTNRSRHNQKYWSFAPCLGLGPSAHSCRYPERYWNTSNVKTYIAEIREGRAPVTGKESLTLEQQYIEAVYLGLRTSRGIRIDGFEKKFGWDFMKILEPLLTNPMLKGHVVVDALHCRLTRQGRVFLDTVAGMLIDAVEVGNEIGSGNIAEE